VKGALLRRVSLAATLGQTSYAEWSAGVAAHQPAWHAFGASRPEIGLAMLLPLSIDCYVVYALESRGGREAAVALGILSASVIVGSLHAAQDVREGATAAAVGLVLVAVLWRLYSGPARPQTLPAGQPAVAAPIEVAPDPVATQPIGAPTDPTPDTRSAAPDRPRADPRSGVGSKPRSARRSRPIAELRSELQAAIAAKALPPDPSANAIRMHLSIAPKTARQLRDELDPTKESRLA
jgi:hypothetical protein